MRQIHSAATAPVSHALAVKFAGQAGEEKAAGHPETKPAWLKTTDRAVPALLPLLWRDFFHGATEWIVILVPLLIGGYSSSRSSARPKPIPPSHRFLPLTRAGRDVLVSFSAGSGGWISHPFFFTNASCHGFPWNTHHAEPAASLA